MSTTEAREFAPSVDHATGDRSGGRVELLVEHLPTMFISCEYPDEMIKAISWSLVDSSFIECDRGYYVQRRFVIALRKEQS